MGALWLPDLPDWLFGAPHVPDVITWQGWQTRSRSTGGYDSILAIGPHHDASSPNADWRNSCRRMWETDADRPIGAVLVRRDGAWVIGAAGATNTQGKGRALRCSNGTIPQDKGNLHVISIEAENNGVGEPWPEAQRLSYTHGIAAIIRGLAEQGAYDAIARTYRLIRLDPHPEWFDVHGHYEYAPDRKIDPAGPPSPWAIPGDPYQRWDMGSFRSDVLAAYSGSVPPAPVKARDMELHRFPPRIYSTDPQDAGDGTVIDPAGPVSADTWRNVAVPLGPDLVQARVQVTVRPIDPNGFVRVTAGGVNPRDCRHSNVNWSAGYPESSPVDVLLDNGTFNVYCSQRCHVVIDWLGWIEAD